MRVLPGRPVEVASVRVEQVAVGRGVRSWRVTFSLACGHQLAVDHRFDWDPFRYSDGSMARKRASRLAEMKTVPCPACGPA